MPTDEQTPPIVVRDVFPVEVTIGGSVYRSARAIVTRDRVHVFIAGDGSPTQVLDAPYDPGASSVPALNAPPRQATHLILSGDQEGTAVHVNRQRGCGCGNPLKAAAVSWLLPGARLGVA